jgi:hypothetical protein
MSVEQTLCRQGTQVAPHGDLGRRHLPGKLPKRDGTTRTDELKDSLTTLSGEHAMTITAAAVRVLHIDRSRL